MKIRELRLIAFGPFTNHRITFEGDGVLHIIYGKNEAGKTTSLRALSQWLYGIPHQSCDDFLHPKASLRIGGIIVNERNELSFERRKGTSKTLRDENDQVLDEGCLREFFGGLDDKTFTSRFAIDYAELRRGGQAVANDGGDLAETLFAAGSGIANLRPLQEQLQKELGDLFKSGGSKPRINENLRRIKELKTDIRNLQLPDSQFHEHELAWQKAQAQQSELSERRAVLRARERKLSEIYQAGPKVQRLSALRSNFATMTATPILSDRFEAEWQEARRALANEESTLKRLREELEKLQAQISGLQIHPRILEYGMAIDRLHERRGSYSKSKIDRQKRVAELEQIRLRLSIKRAELGPVAVGEDDDRWNLPPIERSKIQSLANEGKKLAERRRILQQQIESKEQNCRLLESELTTPDNVLDFSLLAASTKAASRYLDLESQTVGLEARVQQLEAQQTVELSKLHGWTSGPGPLLRFSLPSIDLIDAFDLEGQQANLQLAAAKKMETELRKKLQSKKRSLDRFMREHQVPTVDDLEQTRRKRDAAIQLLIGEVPSKGQPWPTADELIVEYSPGGNLAHAVLGAVRDADRIADQLRENADRVAERERLTTEIDEWNQAIAESMEEIEAATEAIRAIEAKWSELWKPLGLVPKPPRDMRAWIQSSLRVIDLTHQLSEAKIELVNRQNLIFNTNRELRRQLQVAGAPPLDGELSLSSVILASERYLEQLEHARQAWLAKQNELAHEQRELSKARADLSSIERDHADWLGRWRQATAKLRLPADWDLEMVDKFLEAAAEIASCLSQTESLEHRIAGIDRDEQEFIQETNQLLERLDLPPFSDSVEQAVETVFQKRRNTEKDQAVLDKATEQVAEIQSAILAHEHAQALLRSRLDALSLQAQRETWDDVAIVLEEDRRRRELQREMRQLEQDLLHLAAGRDLNEFYDEVLHTDFDALAAQRELVASQINDVEQEFRTISESIGSLRNELDKFDGRSRALEKEEELRMALAKIRTDVEEYSRLRLAITLLESAMEAYREKTQGPVLKLASSYFRKLTLGAFEGLKSEFDSKGRAILVGERSSPRRQVPVEGMSDGTCDQLYLAIRLALLDHHLQSNAPIPFIVDDILVMFDDDRAVAALETLVELSSRTQVIYFTHHQHLASLAQQHFGCRVAVQTLR